MLTLTRASLLFAAAALAACVPDAPAENAPLEDNQGIIGGMDSDATQNAVVRLTLRTDGGIYSCSGTLIAPNLVLTARHCVSATADGNVGCTSAGVGDQGGAVMADYAPGDLTVTVGATRTRPDGGTRGKLMGDAGVRPTGMTIFHDDSTNLCNHDLSLILLSADIAGALISPIRLDTPPTVGETFTAVGWGVTDKTPNPTTRQERLGVEIKAVGPTTAYGGVAPNEFSVGEVVCSGDSGGPALDTTTNAIIGIVSRGGNGQPEDPMNPAASCIGGQNLYTEVAPFKDLILQAFAASGHDPWLEGQPNPELGKFAAPCASNADCQSNLCLGGNDAGMGFCTSDCSTATCPSGYQCHQDDSLGAKVCGLPESHGGCSASPIGSSTGGMSLALLVLAAGWLVARRRVRA